MNSLVKCFQGTDHLKCAPELTSRFFAFLDWPLLNVIMQEHFTQMRIVGQFNLGFMICLLGSDLFILDQHACDEKYNFEVLQKTTTIHQQPLVR